MGKRRKYTEEFKKDAVRLTQARGTKTVSDIATELGVSQSMLHRWRQMYGDEVCGGAQRSQQERGDVERLRRRLRELEIENKLLKKAAALFAQEMK